MKYLFFLAAFCAAISLYAQDNLILKSGEELQVKVIEVGLADITYKKFDNLSGPNFIVSKRDVFMIKYENGTKDVFGNSEQILNTNHVVDTSKPKKTITYLGSGDYEMLRTNASTRIIYYRKLELDTTFKNSKNPDIYKYYKEGRFMYPRAKVGTLISIIVTAAGLVAIGYSVYAENSYNNYVAGGKIDRNASNSWNGDPIRTADQYIFPQVLGGSLSLAGVGMFIASRVSNGICNRKLRTTGELYNQENK